MPLILSHTQQIKICDTAQAAKPQPTARIGMGVCVYLNAIAHDLRNVAKSRVNAGLHAYASPIQSPLKNPREMKQFPQLLIVQRLCATFFEGSTTFDQMLGLTLLA